MGISIRTIGLCRQLILIDETLTWDKTPPGPVLPAEVVAKTSATYLEAYERLTGKKL